jgi:hypothetical protein
MGAMALFVITCRATGRKVSTGIRINGSTWNRGDEFYAYTHCPACKSYHEWSDKDVTLNDEAEPPDFVAVSSTGSITAKSHSSSASGRHRLSLPSGFAGKDDQSSFYRKRSIVNV